MEEENTQQTDGDTGNANSDNESMPRDGMTENEIVVMIIVATLIGVLIFGVYVYSNRRFYGIGISTG